MNIMISTGLHHNQQAARTPLDKGEIVVKQSVYGRMRVRVRSLKDDRIFASWMRERLNNLNGVDNVETREITGSVIINYQPRTISAGQILEEINEQVEFPVIYNLGESLLTDEGAETASAAPVPVASGTQNRTIPSSGSSLMKGAILVGGAFILGLIRLWKNPTASSPLQPTVSATPQLSNNSQATMAQDLSTPVKTATIFGTVAGGFKDALLPANPVIPGTTPPAQTPPAIIARELAGVALRILGVFFPFAARLISFIRTGNEFIRTGALLMAPAAAANALPQPTQALPEPAAVQRCTGCSRNCLVGFEQCPRGLMV